MAKERNGMAKEIERKFLVRDDGWRAAVVATFAIRQFYLLAEPDRSLRVRLKGDSAFLTLKLGPAARERDEYEFPLSVEDAQDMERFALGSVIEKTRYRVRHHALIFDVDTFSGPLSGLVIAELETELEVADADLPPWIGEEVTAKPAFYNASLAVRGMPETIA